MPLKRTPPQSSAEPPGEHYHSEPNLNSPPTKRNPLRSKRKHEKEDSEDNIRSLKSDMRSWFTSLSLEFDQRFNSLQTAIIEVKEQNTDVQASINFMSEKYDVLLNKMKSLEEDKKKDRELIEHLEFKIELLERKSRSAGIEIRNLPTSQAETKTEMCNMVKHLATTVQLELHEAEIKDIYRVNSAKQTMKPLIVEFGSVLKKEKLLMATKQFNRGRPREEKLNTEHLKVVGAKQPIFVSETLTFKAQSLFHHTRAFANENSYAYCWTSKGIVYIRKSENLRALRIDCMDDLEKLRRND